MPVGAFTTPSPIFANEYEKSIEGISPGSGACGCNLIYTWLTLQRRARAEAWARWVPHAFLAPRLPRPVAGQPKRPRKGQGFSERNELALFLEAAAAQVRQSPTSAQRLIKRQELAHRCRATEPFFFGL